MFAALLRLGEWNCKGFFNRFNPRMEPISSWKFVYRMQIQRTFSFRWRTILWFSLFLLTHCRITRDMANRRIMRENIDALRRGILSIILRTGILQHRWFTTMVKSILIIIYLQKMSVLSSNRWHESLTFSWWQMFLVI